MIRPTLAAALAALTFAAPAGAIVGGQVTQREWPHMAGMEYSDNGGRTWSFRCGASLMAPDVVLTAAHCVDDEASGGTLPADRFRFLLGTRVRSSGGERIAAAEVREHPAYQGGGSDVALVKLQRPSTLARTIRLAGAGDASRWEPGDQAVIIGWGSEVSGGDATDALKEATVPIVADDTCRTSYFLTYDIDAATNVCAGETMGGEDSCQGDSGGPMMVQDGAGAWIQIGATSFGVGCAFPTQYGVYAEAGGNALRSWIESNVAQMSAAPAPAPATPPSTDTGSSDPAPLVTRPRGRIVIVSGSLGSARRARRTKRVRVLLRATERVRGVVVELHRGSRVVATARMTSLRGSRRVALRVRGALRAGRVELRASAVDSQGRALRATRKAKLNR